MANDLNRCEFIGRLGKDVEIRYMPNGNAVANLSIAVGETWKDQQSGERQERTTWVPLVFFGKLAEIAGQYLRKGSKIYVAGKFQVRKWQDKDGQDRYTTEIIGNEMQMLDGKGGGGREADDYGAPYSPPQPNRAPAGRPPQGRPQAQAPEPGFSGGLDDFDEFSDLPF